MISEQQQFHGPVFIELTQNSKKPVQIESLKGHYENTAYAINGVGVFIKHSSKRMTPWKFSFYKNHQDTILELKKIFDEVVVILVCGKDGFVGLDFLELKNILNEVHDEIEWIKIDRRIRTQYSVSGTDGKLGFKITRDNFLKKILKDDYIHS